LYLATRTRPDILINVNRLCTKVIAPTVSDRNKLDRIFGYLNDNPNLGFVYNGGGNLDLAAFGDAAFMIWDDVVSQTGSLGMLNGGPVWARSVKQKIRAKNTCESETVAAVDTTENLVPVIELIKDFGMTVDRVPLYQDNKAVIEIVKSGKPASQRTKHFALRIYTLSDLVNAGVIDLVWLNTKDMLADMLSKPLTGCQFVMLRDAVVKSTVV
jgi:hypothetical protein